MDDRGIPAGAVGFADAVATGDWDTARVAAEELLATLESEAVALFHGAMVEDGSGTVDGSGPSVDGLPGEPEGSGDDALPDDREERARQRREFLRRWVERDRPWLEVRGGRFVPGRPIVEPLVALAIARGDTDGARAWLIEAGAPGIGDPLDSCLVWIDAVSDPVRLQTYLDTLGTESEVRAGWSEWLDSLTPR